MGLDERVIDCDDLHGTVLDTGVKDISCSFTSLSFGRSNSRGTYALRKTILPIRPKPLIPTSVSDIVIYGDCELGKVRRGFEEGICRLMLG